MPAPEDFMVEVVNHHEKVNDVADTSSSVKENAQCHASTDRSVSADDVVIDYIRSIASYEDRYQRFLEKYPAYAVQAGAIDEIRQKDFSRLSEQNHVYVDYTGGCLYPQSLVSSHSAQLLDNVLGNPHSTNPTSQLSTDLVESSRHAVLKYLNADPEEYTVVFTVNATAALKLVAECFPFSADSRLLLSADNHNSVGGIREQALRKGARVNFAPIKSPSLRAEEDTWLRLIRNIPRKGGPDTHHLFAFPAQSNFSGVKHSLDFVAEAQKCGWKVLLDTAAFLPTNRLDLSVVKPDFCTASFYKVFGYPTGVGALVAKRSTLELLRQNKPWYCGGVVTVATLNPPVYVLADHEAAFEEGTVAYTSIPAVQKGLEYLTHTVPIDMIESRVTALTDYFLRSLRTLRHQNGRRLVTVLGPADNTNRGGTVSIALWDEQGEWIFPSRIESMATEGKISLRSGCFCNPGAGEAAFGLQGTSVVAEAYRDFGLNDRVYRVERCKEFVPYLPNTSKKACSQNKYVEYFQLREHRRHFIPTIRLPSVSSPSSWMRTFACVPSVSSSEESSPRDESVFDPSNSARSDHSQHAADAHDGGAFKSHVSKNEFLMAVREKVLHAKAPSSTETDIDLDDDDAIAMNTKKAISAIRISMGLASTFADVDAVLRFLCEFLH